MINVIRLTVFSFFGSVAFSASAGAPPIPPGPEGWKFREELANDQVPDYPAPKGKPWLENRISRCFFSPIKRPPFNRDELLDDIDYYPDAYLARLNKEGVNGLWLSIKFSEMTPDAEGKFSPETLKRIAKLRRTVEKCRRHGIKVWAFGIEPHWRKADDPFFASHPEAKGVKTWTGGHVTCTSVPAATEKLEADSESIFRSVPDLGGMILIVNGERPSTCLSLCSPRVDEPEIDCPRCSKRKPWQLYADIAGAISKGMRKVNPDAKLIAWFYNPEARPYRGKWVYECAKHTPPGVVMQYNFESGCEREQEGKIRCGGDYWLSAPGPSGIFRQLSAQSLAAGKPLAAKIQTSCSHECATVPYVPVPGLLYRKFKGMRETGVKDVMMCWYFGNAPGLMNRAAGMLAYEDFRDGEDAFLERLAKAEWGEDAARMGKLWRKFSDAYSHYPFSNRIQYYGPFHAGFSWTMHPLVSMRSLQRSWKPMEAPGGDLMSECLKEFTLEDALGCARKMCAPLDDSVKTEIDSLRAKYASDLKRRRDLGVMITLMNLFRSAEHIFHFYLLRRDAVFASRIDGDHANAAGLVRKMLKILDSEKKITLEMIPVSADDSRLGFHSEAESHQFFPEYLRWRAGEIEKAQREAEAVLAALTAGKPYPESEREKTAQKMPCRLLPDGSLSITWRCPANGGEVVAQTYDLCGTATRKIFKAQPAADGTFTITIPPSEWNRDRRLRPAWIVCRQGRDFNNGGTTWAYPDLPMFPEARLEQEMLTGDNFALLEVQ